ncbi:OprO/OprP family phosphate-selective porin [Novosphingobium endophyticum]|uniref:OprO/OprP family phosphate-selective porin n=1 Tax=Novosphingobium endophyticum TaxID=1955250 RepID=UPI00166A265A
MRPLLASTSLAVALVVWTTPVAAQSVSEAEAEQMRAEIRALRARLEAIESRLQADPAPAVSPSDDRDIGKAAGAIAKAGPATPPTKPDGVDITWKGSPRFAQGDKQFKVKGRIQADANHVSSPDGIEDPGLGFSNEMRRIRLGGEGSVGSGFSYKLELELSDNSVDLVDTFVSYNAGSWQVRLGNHNAFQSLDELTGDTTGSVMERAAFTDAFNFERRLGISAGYASGPWLAQFGVFTDDVGALANDSDGPSGGDENNSYSFDGRLVYAPRIGRTQLHFGGSAHWRRLGRLVDAGTRYRQRPFVHSTNTRLIGTPSLNVETEMHYGLELAAISGRWHGAAEVHALRAERVGLPSVTFRGGYAEVGYFLTPGDSRGYKEGIFTSAAPARPIGKGGAGSIQVNLRYDYLDLDSRDIRGGKQNGYIVGLVWSPIQYLRFNLNYALLSYDGAIALPSGSTGYDVRVVGTRFELDF